MIASAIGDLVTGLGAMAVVVAATVLAVLAILMPYYIYKIRHELDATNKLLRQMIRSSGHEPEA